MKVTVGNAIRTSPAKDMKVGQIAIVKKMPGWNDIAEKHLIRVYGRFVLLEAPQNTWGEAINAEVEVLPPGTTVTLETEV